MTLIVLGGGGEGGGTTEEELAGSGTMTSEEALGAGFTGETEGGGATEEELAKLGTMTSGEAPGAGFSGETEGGATEEELAELGTMTSEEALGAGFTGETEGGTTEEELPGSVVISLEMLICVELRKMLGCAEGKESPVKTDVLPPEGRSTRSSAITATTERKASGTTASVASRVPYFFCFLGDSSCLLI